MMVRKAVGLTALLLLSAILVAGAREKTNPARPQNPRAGRVLVLQEVFRIDDSSGDFFLKYPGNIRFGKDGIILLSDEKQLLTFDGEGNYLDNFYLPPGSMILNTAPGTLFLRQEGEDGNPVIIKYKILDPK